MPMKREALKPTPQSVEPAREVDCPKCKAKAGQRCRTGAGISSRIIHKPRQAAYDALASTTRAT